MGIGKMRCIFGNTLYILKAYVLASILSWKHRVTNHGCFEASRKRSGGVGGGSSGFEEALGSSGVQDANEISKLRFNNKKVTHVG